MALAAESAKHQRRSPSMPRPPGTARTKLIAQCAVRHCTRDGGPCRCDRKPDQACMDDAHSWLTTIEQVTLNQAA